MEYHIAAVLINGNSIDNLPILPVHFASAVVVKSPHQFTRCGMLRCIAGSLGAPVQDGAGRMGCEMGPSALRTAGLVVGADANSAMRSRISAPSQPAAARSRRARQSGAEGAAGDLGLDVGNRRAGLCGKRRRDADLPRRRSLASRPARLPGIARRAAEQGRPLFVLWLDAHPDFHTLDTTTSGNLHGVPLAYASGQPGFRGYFPELPAHGRSDAHLRHRHPQRRSGRAPGARARQA